MTIDDPAVAVWGNPRGATPKQTDDVRKVEITLTVATRGQFDKHGERFDTPAKTEEEVLELVKSLLGVRRDSWPKWLRMIEVDAIYLDGDE